MVCLQVDQKTKSELKNNFQKRPKQKLEFLILSTVGTYWAVNSLAPQPVFSFLFSAVLFPQFYFYVLPFSLIFACLPLLRLCPLCLLISHCPLRARLAVSLVCLPLCLRTHRREWPITTGPTDCKNHTSKHGFIR